MKNLLIFILSDQTRTDQWAYQPGKFQKTIIHFPKHRYEKGNLDALTIYY
ncbi:hypothetical protein AAHN97_20245 [Chitinophaga niabensis]